MLERCSNSPEASTPPDDSLTYCSLLFQLYRDDELQLHKRVLATVLLGVSDHLGAGVHIDIPRAEISRQAERTVPPVHDNILSPEQLLITRDGAKHCIYISGG